VELNKKQTEFWGVILIICLIVSVAIMLVDFQIKQAILEESTRLRLAIEGWEIRTSGLRPNQNRASDNATLNSSIPADVLVDTTAGMEAGNVSNGDKTTTRKPPRKRNAEPS
jgi:hypothetical protein